MLGIISTVFLIYGLRVLARLQAYEQEKKLRMPTMMSDRVMNHSYNMGSLSDDEDGFLWCKSPSSQPRQAKRRPFHQDPQDPVRDGSAFTNRHRRANVHGGNSHSERVRRAPVRQRHRVRVCQSWSQLSEYPSGGMCMGGAVGFPDHQEERGDPSASGAFYGVEIDVSLGNNCAFLRCTNSRLCPGKSRKVKETVGVKITIPTCFARSVVDSPRRRCKPVALAHFRPPFRVEVAFLQGWSKSTTPARRQLLQYRPLQNGPVTACIRLAFLFFTVVHVQ
ncbi:hypothetical protein GQ600_24151 [Phytophthora cactorum]|nr:hypothetical protein GQ600_24151 [Phytophthora cactorum]